MFNPCSDANQSDVIVGSLKQLRKWGFETFPELFDEGYDELLAIPAKKRWKYFVNNIDRLNKMKYSELHRVCDGVYEKCVHNQKTLLNFKIPGEELLSKLKNIVEKY